MPLIAWLLAPELIFGVLWLLIGVPVMLYRTRNER
jgi:hypothetical protein